jgi:NAD(P)-dependent dehydrogenase (short-subunit alcohol dehydrogenase family)
MAETLLMVGVRKLGREIALHFAKQGWKVVCAARTTAEVESLAADVRAAGGEGVAMPCDLTVPSSLAPLSGMHLDLCVAAQTAGGRFGAKPFLELDDEELTRNLDAYVGATWNLLKVVGRVQVRQRRGTFLQIGTSSGVRTKDGFAAIGAAQHALRALVQVAAREWRAAGVHVAYLPIDGPIESARTREWAAQRGATSGSMIPPIEIARACEYLYRQDPRAWTHELVLRPEGGDWTAPT